jgi:hypothetical protein
MRVRRLRSPGRSKSARYPMQAMLEDFLSKHTKASRLMAMLIAQKLEEQGVPGISEKIEDIEREIERAKASGKNEGWQTFHIEGVDDDAHLTLEFSEGDLDAFSIRLNDSVSAAVETLTEHLSEATLKSVREQVNEAVARRASDLEAFESRLVTRWKKPLDLLAVQIGLSAQFGDDTNDYLRDKATPENGESIDCLTRLQARAVQVAGEVEALLKAGYADGAMARWRTLHELVVVAFFISEKGNEVAQRYLDHLVVDSFRMARMYREAAPKLGYAPLDDREWNELEQESAKLTAKYGAPFAKEYGWAAKALDNEKPTFALIEKAVAFEKYRPYYKMASDNVHAGTRGVFSGLARLSHGQDILHSGPSNAGLEEAGRLTAYSLSQIAVTLLTIEPTIDANVWARVLHQMSGEVEAAFIAAKERLDRDESRLDRWAPRKPHKLRAPRQRPV